MCPDTAAQVHEAQEQEQDIHPLILLPGGLSSSTIPPTPARLQVLLMDIQYRDPGRSGTTAPAAHQAPTAPFPEMVNTFVPGAPTWVQSIDGWGQRTNDCLDSLLNFYDPDEFHLFSVCRLVCAVFLVSLLSFLLLESTCRPQTMFPSTCRSPFP